MPQYKAVVDGAVAFAKSKARCVGTFKFEEKDMSLCYVYTVMRFANETFFAFKITAR